MVICEGYFHLKLFMAEYVTRLQIFRETSVNHQVYTACDSAKIILAKGGSTQIEFVAKKAVIT